MIFSPRYEFVKNIEIEGHKLVLCKDRRLSDSLRLIHEVSDLEEAHRLASFEHELLPLVTDIVETDLRCFVVTEYVKGRKFRSEDWDSFRSQVRSLPELMLLSSSNLVRRNDGCWQFRTLLSASKELAFVKSTSPKLSFGLLGILSSLSGWFLSRLMRH